MPDKTTYKKVATVYVKSGSEKGVRTKVVSRNGRIYDALDKLEKFARLLSDINKAVLSTSSGMSRKKKKKIKKYAKINSKTGILVLKKARKAKKGKRVKPAKRKK